MFLPRMTMHAHVIVFAHACGYYLRAATNRGAASIRINTVLIKLMSCYYTLLCTVSLIYNEF